jgi:hypothetical protein
MAEQLYAASALDQQPTCSLPFTPVLKGNGAAFCIAALPVHSRGLARVPCAAGVPLK